LLKAPFASDPGLAGAYLPQLLDEVTVSSAASFPGRININQAPRSLLTAIPGMPPEAVEAIMSNREPEFSGQQADKKYETWIFTQGIVTLDQMKALIPFITTGGSVYRAQIVGFFDEGGTASRAEAIIDTSPIMVASTDGTSSVDDATA